MDAVRLAAVTVAISSSGALSPGPLSLAAVVEGAKGSWRSGIRVAAGHMTFELPFVAVISVAAYELRWALSLPFVRLGLGGTLGAFLAFFAYDIVSDGLRLLRGMSIGGKAKAVQWAGGPLAVGFILTAMNPFFLIWWLTAGLVLVEAASTMGLLVGYSIMYPSHVWMDYAWLALMSYLGQGGRNAIKSKWYGALLVVLGIVMAAAGCYVLASLLL